MTTASQNSLAGLRILVIEDELTIGIVLEELLAEAGVQATLAETVAEARGKLNSGSFDGALLDINLRGQTSHTIADELISRSIPFIVMTGSEARDSDPAVLQGAPRMLKPFNRAELMRNMTAVFCDGAAK